MDNSAISSTAAAAVDRSDLADEEGEDLAPPSMGATKEADRKAAKQMERVAEKERLVNWAKGLKLTDVVLTDKGGDVESLGVCKWSI